MPASALALARSSLELAIADAEGFLASDEIKLQARKLRESGTRLFNMPDIMEEED
ncbi:MAG: hypothetical protein HZB19_19280 [Chloroflexi bacterium]|nr:hypothetical protein [Chloroflexota bacterium]